MIYEELTSKLKQAMRDRDSKMANSLRVIRSRIGEHLVKNRLPRDVIPDDIVVMVLSSYKKGLQKAIDQLSSGGERAQDLISDYKAEIEFCEQYLPDDSQEFLRLESIVGDAIGELGVSDVKQMGRVMGHIMKNNSGLDGKLVKEIVLKKLGG